MTKNLTQGRPLTLLLQFTFPIFLAMLFQQFYNLVDTMIVGKTLGADALAAVGSTGSLNFMVIGFCSGVCAGFAIPIAQAFGAQNERMLKEYIANSCWLCVGFAVVLAVFTGLWCKPILRLMRTPEDLLQNAYLYIDIIFWGIPATFLYNMLSCMIRAVGDSKTPVVFLGLASALNIVLDLVLILYTGLGVAGASIATVAAQGVSGILCLIYIRRRFPILQPSGEQWRFNARRCSHLCSMGVPMGLQYSVTAIGSVILQSAVNTLGNTAIAAITAGSKLVNIFACPFDALGTAIATYSGQNIGAEKPERVRDGVRACAILGSIYAIAALTLFWFAGASLATLFVDPGDSVLIAETHTFLIYNGLFFVLLMLVNVLRFCIQGMGHSNMAILAGLLEMLARSVVGFAFVPLLGYAAACCASPAAWIAADAFLLPAYFHFVRTASRGREKQ